MKYGLATLYSNARVRNIIRGYMCLPLLFHGHITENFNRINYEILDTNTGN